LSFLLQNLKTTLVELAEAKETILSLDTLLSDRMKKYIHYRSMRNFVLHYHEIQSEIAKEKIRVLFSEYIKELRAGDYNFEGEASYDLARNYIFVISKYYKEYSKFMAYMRISVILLFGFTGDCLLYVTDIPSRIFYIPIVTVCFCMYYLFVRIFKEPRGRVFGIFY
jgi:hypothetical protein